MADVTEEIINGVGSCRMPVMGEINESTISIEQVQEAVNEMKAGKGSGLD